MIVVADTSPLNYHDPHRRCGRFGTRLSGQVAMRTSWISTKAALLCAAFLCSPSLSPAAPPPEIISVRKIWDRGAHNAFTDLLRYKAKWYCVFREGDGHAAGDGKLRVLVSNDGESWSSSALVAEAGVDLRDPKLSITPDGRLMMVAGGSVYEHGTYKGRQPRVSFSSDGVDWTAPQRILSEGDWLWRVTWRQGRAYGVSYLSAGSATRSGFLYSSADGIHYQRITEFKAPGVSEVTLRFLSGGEMVALARRESDNKHGWIGSSRPPYTDWEFHEIPRRLGGPNFIQLPNG